MYNVENDEKHFYVVEYKELVFIFAIFIFIFFALFPKDLLKEQIVSKDNDYELSMTYLRNLIKKDPKNESLKLILAQKALQKGDINLSSTLLESLDKSQNNQVSTTALLLNYDLLKQRYFETKDEEKRKELKKKLFVLFVRIYANKLYDNDIKRWYEESVFVNFPQATYYFIQQLINKDPSNIAYLKDGYYLALKYKEKQKAQYYLNLLLLYDKKNIFTWITDKYYLLTQEKKYKQAEALLKKAPQEKKYQKMLAELALVSQQFNIAVKRYMKLFENAKTYDEKKNYFKKILSSLVAAKRYNRAVEFTKENENLFLKDKEMRVFILKSYLAAGKVKEANKFSKKILKKGL